MTKSNYSPNTLYRLPWNLADNAISWLEPTSKCNLFCDGCYRENRDLSHKSIDEIKHELDVFERLRKTDSISIAGGEPLMHPDLPEIVRLVSQKGWKAVINTNGILLTEELLRELKDAGVYGFTFHVDSGQNRPGWKGKNEIELNELRFSLAEMLRRVGGISCSFNATIYPETMQYIPELTKWAQENIDMVHVMVFIIYRLGLYNKDLDFYAGNKKLEKEELYCITESDARRTDITAPEVVDEIRKVYPDFMPCAFLNGTADSDTYKWLLTGRLGNKHEIFGYIGPKFMEIVQTLKHLFTGSYLAYSKPWSQKAGLSYIALAPFDKGIREIAKNYFKSFNLNPKAFFSKIHYQSVMIIQPIDFLENGETNMCDGCPDITVWNDKLVWSCRLEEQYKWGLNVRCVPKHQ